MSEMNIPAVLSGLLVCLITVACSDSENTNGTQDASQLLACPDDYAVGVWFHSGDEVRNTIEYTAEGEFSRVSAIIAFDGLPEAVPPLISTGDYEVGNLVTNENGLEVCEIQATLDGSPVGCLTHVHVDGDLLYESSCDLQFDFDLAYDRVD